MSDRPYDAFGHRFFVPVKGGIMVSTNTFDPGALAIDGTASALVEETNSGMVIPFACKLVAGSRRNYLGATAAVALVSACVCKSVAGTGSLSAIGTYIWNGTCATGASGSGAIVGSNTLAAGDIVSISEAIGTVDAISSHEFILGFEELFN